MRFIITVCGVVAAIFATFVFVDAQSAIHQILGGIFYILAAICIGIAMIDGRLQPPKA